MATAAGVVRRREGPVGHLLLDRPRRANAYADRTLEAFERALAELVAADEVRVVVVGSAASGRFCAGADLSELGRRRAEDALALRSLEVFDRLASCPKPTIAAVDGPAFAGGLELALACDLRVASERARFAFPETSLGLIPTAGGCFRLVRAAGEAVARRMILFGEELDAAAAARCGLVAEVVAPEVLAGRVGWWAERAAARDPLALRLAKQAIGRALAEGGARELACAAQALLYERRHRGGRPGDQGA